jgi:hypothetical protein
MLRSAVDWTIKKLKRAATFLFGKIFRQGPHNEEEKHRIDGLAAQEPNLNGYDLEGF